MNPIIVPVPEGYDSIKANALAAGSVAPARPSAPPFTPTPLEQEIIKEGAKAIRTIPKDSFATTNLVELRNALASALQSPAFGRFRELVDRHNLEQSDSSFAIRSISLGLEASVAFGLGAQGSVGVAVPPGQWENIQEYVAYITAALEVGIVEGAIGGVVLGLYNTQPTDMEGGSYGYAIEFGFVEDIEVEGSFTNINMTGFLGIAITEAGGEEDGIDGLYSYTWVWGWDAPFAYQAPATNFMFLNTIHCNKASESAHDEVYFKFTPDGGTTYRFPTQGQYSMTDRDTWNTNRSINFNDHVTIELFDEDDPSGDDPLGSTTYRVSGFPTSVTVSGSGGQYTLSAVLNPPPPPFPPGKRINSVDTSYNGPYACTFKGKSYVFWRGTNQGVYNSGSPDGVTWPNGTRVTSSDTTSATPSGIEFQGLLYVFFKGNNSGVYFTASSDGNSWPTATGLPGEYTATTPVPCVFNNTLYLFWSTNDAAKRIIYSTFNPATKTWAPNKPINGLDTTGDAVAAVVFNGALYLFWRSSNSTKQMYWTASSTNSWPNGTVTNSGESSSVAPSACVYNGKLYLIFNSTNNAENVRYMVSTDGRTYPASIVSSGANVSTLSTGANVFGEKLCLFFTNPQNLLCASSAAV